MLETFKNILVEMDDLYLRSEIDSIKPEQKIIQDLGIDSLTRVAIFFEVTDHFEVEKDQMDAANWETVSDILSYMESLT